VAATPFHPTHKTDHRSPAPKNSTRRLFFVSAVATLIPVTLIGLVLAAGYRRQAIDQGLAQGRAQATLLATTSIEPVLDGRSLAKGVSNTDAARLNAIVTHASQGMDFLRLRLRDLEGNVVFSSDKSSAEPKDSSALAAAGGHDVTTSRS
jgi:hypothetical protein